ncbi:MAG: hypothetical protein ABSE53_07535 [Terracidiphilus sp.]|jgi:hypothetical protein
MSYLPAALVQMVLAPAIQKKVSSKPKVPIQRFLGCYQMVFEIGAVLGHAFRRNFPWFVQFFSEPGMEQELAMAMNQVAKEHLTSVGEATSFYQLAMKQEESRIEKVWRDAGQSQSQIDGLFKSWEMDPEEAFHALGIALNIGVAYGGTYSDLVEQLWIRSYETPPDPRIAELFGNTNVPWGKWEPLKLADQEQRLLSIVRAFVTENRPDLAEQLEAQLV